MDQWAFWQVGLQYEVDMQPEQRDPPVLGQDSTEQGVEAIFLR